MEDTDNGKDEDEDNEREEDADDKDVGTEEDNDDETLVGVFRVTPGVQRNNWDNGERLGDGAHNDDDEAEESSEDEEGATGEEIEDDELDDDDEGHWASNCSARAASSRFTSPLDAATMASALRLPTYTVLSSAPG